MKPLVGIWIDHSKAVLVFPRGDDFVTRTIQSDVAPHPHWAGAQDGGGEKRYEERHRHDLNRFFDGVIAELQTPDAIYVFGPGEAKLELQKRLARTSRFAGMPVRVEPSDRLTDAQIVAKVREQADSPQPI